MTCSKLKKANDVCRNFQPQIGGDSRVIRACIQHRGAFPLPRSVTIRFVCYLLNKNRHDIEHGHSHGHSHGGTSAPTSKPSSITSSISDRGDATTAQRTPGRGRKQSLSDSYTSFSGHPAATRASLVQVAQDMALATSPTSTQKSSDHMMPTNSSQDSLQHGNRILFPHKPASSLPQNQVSPTTDQEYSENTPLLNDDSGAHSHDSPSSDNTLIQGQANGHNSESGSMNMRALLLHVLGDALGNVGVIATGLVIWLTTWSFKYYFDPVISLVITVIIFSSALPLGMSLPIWLLHATDSPSIVRSASFILLQGVPSTVSIEEVRSSILEIEGVLSLHELHVWQLSESKIIASVHVLASREHDFMPVAAKIRKALHLRGIHSSTIQPEYYHARAMPEDRLKVRANDHAL